MSIQKIISAYAAIEEVVKKTINCLKPAKEPVGELTVYKIYKEIKIPSPWGTLCGKWWGSQSKRPVLCLHNINENCGSFDRLIPILSEGIGFLAIDMLGHGLSDHLPAGSYYNDVTMLLMIHYIKLYFKWTKISLMGHSTGGILAFLYTLLSPKDVDFVIFIDGFYPNYGFQYNKPERLFVDIEKILEMERSFKYPQPIPLHDHKTRLYASTKQSIEFVYTPHIVNRQVNPSKKYIDSYYGTRDPKMNHFSMAMFDKEDCIKGCKNILFPVLILKTKESPCFTSLNEFLDHYRALLVGSRNCILREVAGTHHVHLNKPEIVATIINAFIRRYNSINRGDSGLKAYYRIQNETNE